MSGVLLPGVSVEGLVNWKQRSIQRWAKNSSGKNQCHWQCVAKNTSEEKMAILPFNEHRNITQNKYYQTTTMVTTKKIQENLLQSHIIIITPPVYWTEHVEIQCVDSSYNHIKMAHTKGRTFWIKCLWKSDSCQVSSLWLSSGFCLSALTSAYGHALKIRQTLPG